MSTTISTDIHVNSTTEVDCAIYPTPEGYRATVNLDDATIYLDPADLDRVLGVLLAVRATINQEPDLTTRWRHKVSEDDCLVTVRHLSHHEQMRMALGDQPEWVRDACAIEGPVLVSKVVPLD